MPLPSFPFVAAATTSAKKTATSAHAGWRAFSFLMKVASDDWDWSELATVLTSHLEQSPDARAGIERMAMVALGGLLLFWAALAAITYFIWRRKSCVMRERIAVLTEYNAMRAETIAVQTGNIGMMRVIIDMMRETNVMLTRCAKEATEALALSAGRRHANAW